MKIGNYLHLTVSILAILILGCQSPSHHSDKSYSNGPYKFGGLAIIQGATSDSKTSFNVLIPRLKSKAYKAVVYEKGSRGPKNSGEIKDSRFIQPTKTSFTTDEKGLTHWGIKRYVFENLDKI